jgi:beta-aspartyl-peptidase (threonine type)
MTKSEGLFFSGGDQWNYVSKWNNTYVTQGIQWLVENKRPVSGSSAGLAILGQYVYTAEYGSAVSNVSLEYPFNPTITLTNDFLHLPLMNNIFTDTHFIQVCILHELLFHS